MSPLLTPQVTVPVWVWGHAHDEHGEDQKPAEHWLRDDPQAVTQIPWLPHLLEKDIQVFFKQPFRRTLVESNPKYPKQ